MDVLIAFLDGRLSEEVYKRQIPGFATMNALGRPFILKLRRSFTDDCGSRQNRGTAPLAMTYESLVSCRRLAIRACTLREAGTAT